MSHSFLSGKGSGWVAFDFRWPLSFLSPSLLLPSFFPPSLPPLFPFPSLPSLSQPRKQRFHHRWMRWLSYCLKSLHYNWMILILQKSSSARRYLSKATVLCRRFYLNYQFLVACINPCIIELHRWARHKKDGTQSLAIYIWSQSEEVRIVYGSFICLKNKALLMHEYLTWCRRQNAKKNTNPVDICLHKAAILDGVSYLTFVHQNDS